jgi:hypothetical protein
MATIAVLLGVLFAAMSGEPTEDKRPEAQFRPVVAFQAGPKPKLLLVSRDVSRTETSTQGRKAE